MATDLEKARYSLASGFTKISIRLVDIYINQVEMIESVKKFESKLEGYGLADRSIFQ